MGQRLLHHGRKRIADACERDLCLRRRRARRQLAELALTREPFGLLPEHGLADPRVALEQQCLSAGRNRAQETIDGQQLLAPADDVDRQGSALEVEPGAAGHGVAEALVPRCERLQRRRHHERRRGNDTAEDGSPPENQASMVPRDSRRVNRRADRRTARVVEA